MGITKKIVVGVAVTVISTVILAYLGVDRKPLPPPSPPSLDVSGTWQSENNISFIIAQSGHSLSVNATYGFSPFGIPVGQGQGTINGQDVKISFSNNGGKMRLGLSADGNQMTGTYESWAGSKVLALYRQ